MPRDANGTYTLPAGNPVVSGTVIASTWANDTMADVGVEMSDSLSRSGQGGMLAPFKSVAGAVGTPGISWVDEPSSGWFRNTTNDFRFAVAGVERLKVDSSGLTVSGSFTSPGIDDNATSTALNIDSSQNVSVYGDLTLQASSPVLSVKVTADTEFASLNFKNTVGVTQARVISDIDQSDLAFQTNGTTTVLTLDSSQNATFAGSISGEAVLNLGTQDTTRGIVNINGHGAGVPWGGYTDTYMSADYDTTNNFWRHGVYQDDYIFSIDGTTTALTLDSAQKATFSGDVDMTAGTATAATQTAGDNSTKVATTAYVDAAAGGGGGTAPVVNAYTTTGGNSWNKPAASNFLGVFVEVQAGGGGGGDAYASGTPNTAASGGAGGGYAKKWIPAASLNDPETATVGIAGVRGSSNGQSGTAGGASSFGGHCSATGGGGGTGATGTTTTSRPTGGTGTGGDINISGQDGGAAGDGAYPTASNGGGSMMGNGGQSTPNTAGVAGSGYGAGGGGGIQENTGPTSQNGGHGSQGIVVVTEVYG